MKNKTQIGFAGEVQPANCECHKGMYMCVAFLIHPEQGRIYLGNNAFPTEEIAKKELDGFVKVAALETLKIMGLEPDEAEKVTVTHGDEAVKSERRIMAENNPNLH